jgi:hypothetical protein
MRHTSSIIVVVFVALVLSSACEQTVSKLPVSPSSVSVNEKPAPSGYLNVTPGSGPAGIRPIITWSTTAQTGVVQVCDVSGPDCLYREVARGISGSVTELPLPSGNRRYRLLGINPNSPVFLLATREVVVQ